MTLDEAIEISNTPEALAIISLDPDLKNAVKLGIEALKECIKAREGDPALDGDLLPGETEE